MHMDGTAPSHAHGVMHAHGREVAAHVRREHGDAVPSHGRAAPQPQPDAEADAPGQQRAPMRRPAAQLERKRGRDEGRPR